MRPATILLAALFSALATAQTTHCFSTPEPVGPYTLVQRCEYQTQRYLAEGVISLSAPNQAGSLLQVWIFEDNSANHTFTVSDTNQNQYIQAETAHQMLSCCSGTGALFTAFNAKAGANVITVVGDKAAYIAVVVREYQKAGGFLSALDPTGLGVNVGLTDEPNITLNTTMSGDLITVGTIWSDFQTPALCPGEGNPDYVPGPPPGGKLVVFDIYQPTAGQITDCLNAAKNGWAMFAAAFEGGGGSATGSIVASAGTPQSAVVNTAFTTALQATVTDSGGNPVSGAAVTFAAPSGGASVTFGGPATVNTNASGIATAPTLTANGTTGGYTVTASVANIASPASFSLTNTVSGPASIVASAGMSQSAVVNTAFVTALQATVQDSGSNPVSGAMVTFAAPASGASGAFGGSASANVATNASGVATAPIFTANATIGGYTITASVAGVTIPAKFGLTNAAAGGGSLAGTGSSSNTPVNLTTEGSTDWVHFGDGSLNRKAGVPAQLSSYTVVGSGGVQTYMNDPRTVSWSDGTPTISSSNNPNGVYINGVGKGFSLTAPADTTLRTLIVHVGGYNSGGTLSAHLSDGSAADFIDTTATTKGQQYDRNYTLLYQAASTTQTLNVTWKMASGSGNVTLNAVAIQGSSSAATGSIVASAGTAQSAVVTTAFTTALQATVTDSGGNPVSGAAVTFAAPAIGASGTFDGPATVNTDASGVATAPILTANATPGEYTVTASVASVATPASFNLTNTAVPTGSIVASAGTPQSATVTTAFTTALQATVTDSGGNPVSGAAVTFAAPTSGASGTFSGPATVNTGASGVATAPMFTANATPGGYTVTASVASVPTPANFSLTNTAVPTGSIVASAGTPQSAVVTTAFTTALKATVADGGGNPVSGVAVTFAAPATGASGTFGGPATVNTDASGVATAPTLTANATPGGYTVTASVASVATPARFSLTNTFAGGGSLTGAGTSATTVVNLTTEGSTDWEHFGDSKLNRKASVPAQLSTYTVVGSGGVQTYINDPRPVNWTDGAPTASSSNNRNGLYINGVGQGFSFTAPADTTQRTLVVHVGGYRSGGTLTAHLSDGSAADFTDTTANVSGQFDRTYTLSYQAASALQTLKITWKMAAGNGNVTLNGAALH